MAKITIEQLRNKVPEEFSRQRMAEMSAQSALGSVELTPFVEEITAVLQSPEVNQLIDDGKLTLAMIKPRLHEAIDKNSIDKEKMDDALLAEHLESSIKAPLSVVFSISLKLSEEMVNTWYSGSPKERQLQLPPEDPNRYGKQYENRWEEFMALMTHGPVTFLLVYDESGNAVDNWRAQMGNDWKMDRVKQKYPDSLRAKYGIDDHNNLLHGSDSPESVKKEIDFVIQALRKTATK